MGNENLFSKRKAKNEKDLARKRAKRSSYEKILIVCEGQKTEPNYFNELKDFYQLNTANVVVDGNCGSDPWSVYQHAQKCARKAKKDNDPYDKIYCVFDKDKHTTYQKTLNAITSKKSFTAINSVPCFEYWLLLHFTYTAKPFNAIGNKSSGDGAIDKLKEYLPEYQKGDLGIFRKLVLKLESAKTNAQRAIDESIANQTDNPSTIIHKLVSCLQNLKNPQTNQCE